MTKTVPLNWPDNMPKPGEIVRDEVGFAYEVIPKLYADAIPYGRIVEGPNKGVEVILTQLASTDEARRRD